MAKDKKVKPEKNVQQVTKEKSSKHAIRLSTKLILYIGTITVLCLVFMAYMQSRDTTELNINSTINNVQTALSAQDMLLVQFINDSEDSLKQYSTGVTLKNLLENPDDVEAQEAAEAYTLDFYGHLPGWEGIYVSTTETVVLAHSSPGAIGMQTRKGDAIAPFLATMTPENGGFYDAGVFQSPASGQMILNVRQAIYNDNGDMIGFAGGGPFVAQLGEKLRDYKISGLDDVQYTILDTNQMLYVIDPDEEKVCQPIEDELMLNIIDRTANGETTGILETDTDIICFREFESFPLILTAKVPIEDIKALSNEITNRLVIYCAGTLVLILLGILYVTTTSTKPLRRLAKATEQLAEGYVEKPINVKCYVKETIQIKEASVKLQQALKELKRHLSTTANSLSDSAHMTHNICASSEDSTTLISSAMEGLTQSVNSMESSVQQLKNEMSDIEDNVNHIGTSIGALSESSESMDKISEQAMADINEVIHSSEKSVGAANEISEKMAELNEAIEAVSKASEIIAGISSQTSLLSLNASIEAARAGEMGKGFAVVADEIGKLAAQSDQSTKQIDNVITRMQELAKISVDAAENIKEIIINEQEIVKQTQTSFTELKGQIDGSIEQIAQISEANTRLTMSKDSAMSSVDSLASISQDNAESNNKVNDSLSGLTENVETLYGKTEDMSSMADTLEDVISVFKD